MSHLSISKTIKARPPVSEDRIRKIKTEILGDAYELSLVFIGDRLSRKLNKRYREKDKPTNVLSFPLSEESGEIFLNTDALKREHDEFGMSRKKFAAYLIIHAMLHLKGHEHGSRMDDEERRILKRFS